MKNLHFVFVRLVLALALLVFVSNCTKNTPIPSSNNNQENNVSLKDTSQIKRHEAYLKIGMALPEIRYLLGEYRITHQDVWRAIIGDSIPSAFNEGGNIEKYVDWTILKKSIIDCEVNWYHLKEKFPALKAHGPLSKAIRSSLMDFDTSSVTIVLRTTDAFTGITFGVGADGSIGAIYGTGDPVMLPEVVVTAVVYNHFFSSNYAPGRGGPSFNPGAAIARSREMLRKRAIKARNDFEAAVRQDDGKRPQAIKGEDIVKCFNDGKTMKEYRLTLYVDQPVPGKVDAMNITSGDVGHTFIGLEKINMDGSKVSRTFGFYPTGEGKDQVYSKGTLRNNQLHAYDISVTRVFTDQTSFNVLVQRIKGMDNRNYLLYGKPIDGTFRHSFNCTDAALEMAVAGGMTVPRGFAMYFGPFLPGNCPGKLGEEVRKNAGSPPADVLGQKSQLYNTRGGVAPQDQGCK